MKKVLIVLAVIIGLFGGYLVYDWITVSDRRANAPVVNIYSWKSDDGSVHFSDKPPPPDAKEIHKTQGQAYVAPPLAIRMKERAVEWYSSKKEGISKRSDKRPRKKSQQ